MKYVLIANIVTGSLAGYLNYLLGKIGEGMLMSFCVGVSATHLACLAFRGGENE